MSSNDNNLIPVDHGILHYAASLSGPASGPIIILSHALMSNSQIWDSTVSALHAAGYRTLTYDQPGHNRTPQPPDHLVTKIHFDDLTRHIHEILVVLAGPDAKAYGFIGCSMGGVLALRYAMLFPNEVSRVISCDAPGMTSLEASKSKWRDRITMWKEQGHEVLAKATVERWFPDPCSPEVKEKALGQVLTCTLNGYTCCAEGIMGYDYTESLDGELGEGSDNRAKIMILMGEKDEAIGPKSVLLDVHRRIKGSEFVEMKDVGHIPPMHDAEGFERIVLEFLK